MLGDLGLLFEDMKDLRRRGEWSARPEPMSDAQRAILTKLAAILDPGPDLETRDPASMVRLIDIKALAERVFGDFQKAENWLHRSNASLSGQRPIDLLTDDLGAAVVRETLERIDNGMFA